MKNFSTLRTLPLVGLLALGLALPAVSMADDDKRGRGHDRVYTKHDGGKGHQRDHRRSHRDGKGHHNSGLKHGHNKGHKFGGHKHVNNYSSGHGHKYRGHKHPGRGHRHVDHVIVHDRYDHLSDYDRVRLMLGLHFDNIDIIYRDY